MAFTVNLTARHGEKGRKHGRAVQPVHIRSEAGIKYHGKLGGNHWITLVGLGNGTENSMENTGLIYKQIPKVMAAIGAIGKDRKNPQQGYSFRGIDDLYNACNASLAEHEVFAVPKVTNVTREERTTKSGGTLIYTILTVGYTFYASDGSSFECVTIGEAMDSGDKSCNKAMSAAQKYAFLQVFSIPTEEPKDSENETHTVTPKSTKPPASGKQTDKNTSLVERGYIEEVAVTTGRTEKGQWTRYGVRIRDSWFGTFSDTIGKNAQTLKGNEVVLSYTTDGKHSTITEIVEVA